MQLHLIQLARSTIRDRQLAVYREAVAAMRAEHGDEALSRIDECVDVYLRRRAPIYTHEKQRPAAMYIPRLEPRETPDIAEMSPSSARISIRPLAYSVTVRWT